MDNSDTVKSKILVVDDNRSLTDALEKYFNHSGYESEGINSAHQLTQRLSGQAPISIILDINLGDGDGIKLLPELKAVWPGVPVVMLTAMGYDDKLMEEARRHGAQGFVSKSVPPQEMLAKVQGVLEHPEHHS
ncbi:MAG: response regulator [Verrucomicrobiota bacterium]